MSAKLEILVSFLALLLSFLVIGECAKTESGQECDSVCRKDGSRFWCHHSEGFVGWDYCTPDTERSGSTDVITAHGLKCLDNCTRQGDAGARCKTVSYKSKFVSYDWDYCSPAPGLDYKGRTCTDACEFRGKSYKWCNREASKARDARSSEEMIEGARKYGRKLVDTALTPFTYFARNKWGYC